MMQSAPSPFRRLFYHLKEDLIAFDHAELAASSLLDRLEADFQILHLGFQRRITFAKAPIDLALGIDLLVDLPHSEPAPFAEPQRVLDQQHEHCKHQRELFHRPFLT